MDYDRELYEQSSYIDEETALSLIAKGADPNAAVGSDGETALHVAAARNAGVVETLLKAGADPFSRDNDGRTPLHYAAEAGNVASIEMLCRESYNLSNEHAAYGDTALAFAVDENHPEAVAALIAEGASLEDAVRYPETILARVAEKGSTECVKLLVDAGCDPNAKDYFGRTPIEYSSSDEVRTAFIRSGADLSILAENEHKALDKAAEPAPEAPTEVPARRRRI